MTRILVTFGLCLTCLTSPCQSFSQSNDRKLDNALAEIAALKRTVAEQERRIRDLELAMGFKLKHDEPANQSAQSSTPTLAEPWKTPAAWKRIREGMSSAQVAAILGKATSLETGGPYQTMFYQGEVAGSGSVTGTVPFGSESGYVH